MNTVSFLIKPASGRCNLRCRYCFYEDETEHRQQADLGLMTEDTARALIRAAGESAGERVCFSFQGGEPMVRGLPFYQRFVELEKEYLRPGLRVEHTIQTNGTLVTPEWADFFRENHFLVGLSLDGTRALHNDNRVDAEGRGSWDGVVKTLRLLQKQGVDVNLLCVVTGQTARRGYAVYESLKKLGCRYLQFIPCLDPLGTERGSMPWSLTPQRYGQFLCAVFDPWYRDWKAGDYVSVRTFDDYVHLLAGQPAGSCATAGECGQYLVVEGDGSVYPCDFFVLDEWRMGTIQEQYPDELVQSPPAVKFCAEGRGAPAECENCEWRTLCRGGCRRDWIGTERNYQCGAMKTFFAHAMPRLQEIAREEARMQRLMRRG